MQKHLDKIVGWTTPRSTQYCRRAGFISNPLKQTLSHYYHYLEDYFRFKLFNPPYLYAYRFKRF